MNKKSYFLITAFLFLATGMAIIMRNAGTYLVKPGPQHKADAMVLLMGSIPDRVLQAADLYKSGLANKLIIVHENMDAYRELQARGATIISTTQQCRDASVALGIPADSIILLPGDAQSTQDEAVLVREYIRAHPSIDTLTLVSSSDHTRRATIIFIKAFKKQGMPVVVYCSPSKYTNYTGVGWWKTKEGIQTVLMEFLKIANFWMFDIHKL